MCGIVAWLACSKNKETETLCILLEGLQRMEFRGYDSAGIALMLVNKTQNQEARLQVTKKVGKVSNLSHLSSHDLRGGSKTSDMLLVGGIAHTRWATHGEPSDLNAHPHTSSDGRLAVVHNGIVENYSVLRAHLRDKGYVFQSQTDTEVLAHLFKYVQSLEPTLALEDVVALALTYVTGAYGICVIDANDPYKLVGARRGSPLLLGVGEDGICLASDASALVGRAKQVVYLEDGDMVVCTLGKGTPQECFEIRQLTPHTASTTAHEANKRVRRTLDDVTVEIATHMGNYSNRVERELHKLELSLEKIERGGHKHFMIKEILEQPKVLQDCMRGRIVTNPSTGQRETHLGGLQDVMPRILTAKRIIITACGTSWHSAMVAEYMIESLAKVSVEVEYASEFRYRNPIIRPEEDIVVAISQSGETADTMEAVRIAKHAGALCLGFVNCIGSSIATLTGKGIYLHVGPEIGVASTKAFSGQVMALAMFAIHLGSANGQLSSARVDELLSALESVPDKIATLLQPNKLKEVEKIAREYRYANNFLFLGRGPNMPVALEGALKLKEISYIHAEGYPAAELKHGPIALIDRFMPVVVIAPRFDSIYEKVKSSIEEVVARKGSVIALTDEDNHELDDMCECVIRVPNVNEFVSPLITCVPLQLLAYYIADMRGCPIDQPRNLAKSVTVE
ncbi:glutamine-fructose-6-phosphate transaminase (isomerizing) [Batrachochytrium salamandrivorans]|nr:glutamine-fructose-6-phosphate transaminase (isomerizing) [Batrachochytrium salamandrivorans]